MPKPKSNLRRAAGRVSYYSRGDVGTPEKLAAARRDLRAARVERAIHEALAADVPPTDEQRRQLAAILLNGGGR